MCNILCIGLCKLLWQCAGKRWEGEGGRNRWTWKRKKRRGNEWAAGGGRKYAELLNSLCSIGTHTTNWLWDSQPAAWLIVSTYSLIALAAFFKDTTVLSEKYVDIERNSMKYMSTDQSLCQHTWSTTWYTLSGWQRPQPNHISMLWSKMVQQLVYKAIVLPCVVHSTWRRHRCFDQRWFNSWSTRLLCYHV